MAYFVVRYYPSKNRTLAEQSIDAARKKGLFVEDTLPRGTTYY
jgi:hypothetical protein